MLFFSNLGQSLRLIQSPLVIIIVIKIITSRSFGEKREIDPPHVNGFGEQSVAENREGRFLLLRVSSIFMPLRVISGEYKGSGFCGCLQTEWQ